MNMSMIVHMEHARRRLLRYPVVAEFWPRAFVP